MSKLYTVWFVGGKGQQWVSRQSRFLLVSQREVQELLEVHPGSREVLVAPDHTLSSSRFLLGN